MTYLFYFIEVFFNHKQVKIIPHSFELIVKWTKINTENSI